MRTTVGPVSFATLGWVLGGGVGSRSGPKHPRPHFDSKYSFHFGCMVLFGREAEKA